MDGIIFAEMILRKPLDREKHPHLSLKLIAVDGGTPQRSGTVNIEITILDANDNAPVFNQSVYRATVIENAPIGTYITTVNASDADAGSYGSVTYYFSNIKGGVADLFNIDSASVSARDVDWNQNARVSYLLEDTQVNVSFLFITCLVVIISVKIYRWRQSRILYHSNLPVIPYYPPRYSDTLGTGTLQHVYNYEVCRTTDSRKSDCKFGNAGSQNVLIMDPSSTGTMQRIQSEKSIP
ncbi:hypothetical protein CRUP_013768, partial [Coryphaenoides rupestris]